MVFYTNFATLSSTTSVSEFPDIRDRKKKKVGNRIGHVILLGRQGCKATSSGNRGPLVYFSTEMGLSIMMDNSPRVAFRKKYS